ncbi:hypothetical protein QAD02_015784 [Eretmocerus hayati]|uniref:Uncharacterized protein n=1 Tax=Eretmocerus hayati TaxID=131215 RepID=A0ACC2P978_9HYME|nr:hypothetical protein QAD02_015784 [Eretmocerus hayati]
MINFGILPSEEVISGELLFELGLDEMLAMKIKMGHVKQLQKIVSKLSEAETSEPHQSSKKNEGESTAKTAETSSSNPTEPGGKMLKRSSQDSLSTTSAPTTIKSDNCPKRPKIPGVSTNFPQLPAQPPAQPPAKPSSSESEPKSKIPKNVFSRYKTITEMLLNHKQGSTLISALKNLKKPFTEKNRKALVRKIVAELIQAQGNNNYPPHEAKLALAMALVNEFPRLKNRRDPLGFEIYYHPETKKGFIATRLRNLTRDLPKDVKPYKKFDKTVCESKESSDPEENDPVLLSESELNSKISIMNRKNPADDEDREVINKIMAETYHTRRLWIIKKSPSVTAVQEKYIHIKSAYGEMADKEFHRICKGKGDGFIAQFTSFYEKRLIIYAEFAKPSLLIKYEDVTNGSLKALMVLLELLPFICKSKKSKTREQNNNGKVATEHKQGKLKDEGHDPTNYLLRICTDGIDPKSYVEQVREQESSHVQPYMLGVGPADRRHYFVVADNLIFSRRDTTDVVSTFDLLFKIFYIFNLDYPEPLNYFYYFLESFLYDVKDRTTGSIKSLHVNLLNIQVGPEIDGENDSSDSSRDCV